MKIKKILIANRGEIACRLITACQVAGIKSVAVYSEADARARHVQMADEAVLLGPGPANESYLCVEKILDAAKKTGASAVHPGYGFLSERAHFAKAVQDAGLIWIGPDPKVIDLMGSKIAAKMAAEKANVPTLAWGRSEKGDVSELKKIAERIGYPVLLKAASGGGGRGMRLIERSDELEEKAQSAMREAQGAFGSSEVFLEKYCAGGRHIEVQVFADKFGNTVAFGERECSVQRRHQKVIEEAPAANLKDETRKKLHEAGIRLAKEVGYSNAGTCEFLVDEKEDFYFLEMNTRLQVEHPVTEYVWGIDLPVLQFKVAAGEKISEEVLKASPRGHSIEVRLYAEDPSKSFMPSPGKIDYFSVPNMPGIRLDTGYETGGEVPLYYDAMIAKVIANASSREDARKLLIQALKNTKICGVASNANYLIDILAHPQFIDGAKNGNITTQFLAEKFSDWKGVVRMQNESSLESSVDSEIVTETVINPFYYFGSQFEQYRSRSLKRSKNQTSRKKQNEDFSDSGMISSSAPLIAEQPSKVLKILVKNSELVKKGQPVIVCESMKMEFSYSAAGDLKVKKIHVESGQTVAAGTVLVEWEELK